MFSTLYTVKPEHKRVAKLLTIAASAAVLVACASRGDGAESRSAGLPSYSLDSKSGTVTSVNRYLWMASLETLDFLPIFSADPIAGVIVTDWYAVPGPNGSSPTERFKTNVFILDTSLRADALRVSVFRQQLGVNGWIDAPVNSATAREMENAILSRARELRLNSLG